jgi:GNAT superfamily N-acetyltransferase
MNTREAIREDVVSIERIYNEIHEAEEKGILTTGWMRGIYPTRKTAEESISRGDMFVLEDNEANIVGAAIINQIQVDVYENADWEYDTDSVCVLHTLAVSPQSAGKGYGRALVEYYEWWAKEHDLPELRIDTNARNAKARRMYKNMGYKEIGIVPTIFNGIHGVDLVLLEKNLDRREEK